jgi:hypothetical protein
MDVGALLAQAWAEVEKAGLPAEMKEVAFKEAIALLARESDDYVAPESAPKKARVTSAPSTKAAGSPKIEAEDRGSMASSASSDELFDKFAHEVGIEKDDLEQVFYFENGLPILNGPTRKLGASKAAQCRAVALALAVAYHFVLDVTDISIKSIREECERLKCYDQDNFSAYLGSAKGVNYIGPRGKKVLRVKADAIDLVRTLVDSIRSA